MKIFSYNSYSYKYYIFGIKKEINVTLLTLDYFDVSQRFPLTEFKKVLLYNIHFPTSAYFLLYSSCII